MKTPNRKIGRDGTVNQDKEGESLSLPLFTHNTQSRLPSLYTHRQSRLLFLCIHTHEAQRKPLPFGSQERENLIARQAFFLAPFPSNHWWSLVVPGSFRIVAGSCWWALVVAGSSW